MENAIISRPKTSPKDFFLHLLSIITLYTSAVSFLIVIFQYINIYFPDVLEFDYYRFSGIFDLIRNSIATLIVFFPAYILISRYLGKSYAASPEKLDLRIRKWLIYFTLFIAALVIMGDLVALIRQLLEGGLATRFLLKILAVGFVAGSIFFYYFNNLKETRKRVVKVYSYVVIAIVAITIVAGFFIAGTPNEARDQKADQQKILDLQNIQSMVISYWQAKKELPANLTALVDETQGTFPPADPETGAEYGYQILDAVKLKFELCADFKTSNLGEVETEVKPGDPSYSRIPSAGSLELNLQAEWNWQHDIGHTCFERLIDPDKYPPFSKTKI